MNPNIADNLALRHGDNFEASGNEFRNRFLKRFWRNDLERRPSTVEQRRFIFHWRLVAVVGWITMTLLMAGIAVLKSTTTAGDFGFLPSTWVLWLDKNYDLRTLIMMLCVAAPPALLLWHRDWNFIRRSMLALIVALLTLFECLQLWIPSRGFSFADIFYTFAGGLLAECLAAITQLAKKKIAGSAI